MATQMVAPKVFSLRGHPEWNESFVQQYIANDPAALGLGDLLLRDKERVQAGRGRLDLLLQSDNREAWYEVEVQLGPTDESHIIRTIEYWDVERKRYPEISHTAVIVAEEITSRFFNVIALFNQSIPLIAIKMTAIKVGEHSSLLFTKILDYTPKGPPEEEADSQPADRSAWESWSGKEMLAFIDQILTPAKECDPTVTLTFHRNYLGTSVAGSVSNFVTFEPQRRALRIGLHMAESVQVSEQLDQNELLWEYRDGRYPAYRIKIPKDALEKHIDVLRALGVAAYKEVEGSPELH
jgi:hypothetical protein